MERTSLKGIESVKGNFIDSPYITPETLIFLLREGFTLTRRSAIRVFKTEDMTYEVIIKFSKIRIVRTQDAYAENFANYPYTMGEKGFIDAYNEVISYLKYLKVLT